VSFHRGRGVLGRASGPDARGEGRDGGILSAVRGQGGRGSGADSEVVDGIRASRWKNAYGTQSRFSGSSGKGQGRGGGTRGRAVPMIGPLLAGDVFSPRPPAVCRKEGFSIRVGWVGGEGRRRPFAKFSRMISQAHPWASRRNVLWKASPPLALDDHHAGGQPFFFFSFFFFFSCGDAVSGRFTPVHEAARRVGTFGGGHQQLDHRVHPSRPEGPSGPAEADLPDRTWSEGRDLEKGPGRNRSLPGVRLGSAHGLQGLLPTADVRKRAWGLGWGPGHPGSAQSGRRRERTRVDGFCSERLEDGRGFCRCRRAGSPGRSPSRPRNGTPGVDPRGSPGRRERVPEQDRPRRCGFW